MALKEELRLSPERGARPSPEEKAWPGLKEADPGPRAEAWP